MAASRSLHHPWVPTPATAADYQAILERARDPSVDTLLACLRGDGAIVGVFTISQIVRGHFQSAYLGYAAAAAQAGQGYMTEAMELVLRRAFQELRLHRLEANIQPANQRSIALARRCGFVLEGYSENYLKVKGRWRDHERWAIRAEQWQAHRRRAT